MLALQAYLGLCTHCGPTVYYAIMMCGQMVLLCIINVMLSEKFFHASEGAAMHIEIVFIPLHIIPEMLDFLSRSLC